MIDFELFHFATAPQTGGLWILSACKKVGLKSNRVPVVHDGFPEERSGDAIRLSCVRHPCDWLVAYYRNVHPNSVGLPEADQFRWQAESFDDFVRQYLANAPGAVGKMMTSYEADSYLRFEDLPLAFVEMLESLGVPRSLASKCFQQAPVAAEPFEWNPQLRNAVMRAEAEFLDHFQYYW